MVSKMKVLITGGTGFLGRALIKHLLHTSDNEIIVYSRDEAKQQLISERWPQIKCVLGDVLNPTRLKWAMASVDVVIHTAAVKFIPEAEYNISECIDINVLGSRNVFQAAAEVGVQRVCAISTDKVCQPVNTYGMTKALMEKLVVEYSRYTTRTKYTACRYGNVIGSTGSVIPLFRRQALFDKKVTVTDPWMTRYWISSRQAVQLVQETLEAETGDILIPQPASMRIGELAELIAEPHHARVEIVGVRPGEKRHEQLLHQQESVRAQFDGVNYRLHPNGVYSEPFMLSSNDPQHWWGAAEMREEIEMAEYV
jgi:UDP-N-acetylglucosamine 4,6-dehydratase